MKVSNLIREGYFNNDGVSLYKIALDIYSMSIDAWDEEHNELPTEEQKIEAIKGVLSQLHAELKDVIEEYKDS